MKSKIYKILISLVFILMTIVSSFFSDTGNKAKAVEIPFHLGQGYCTCKNSICQDGNYFGFRKICHDFGNLGGSPNDEMCNIYSSNCMSQE